MLVLSALHSLLTKVLSPPDLHTAVLLTRAGQLVSTAHDPSRSKDEIRVVVGLCSEVWRENENQGFAMLDTEQYGRILVLPVDEPRESEVPLPENHQPLMLLALNGSPTASWDDLRAKGAVLASHLAKPLSRYRDHLAAPPGPVAGSSAMTPGHPPTR